MAAISKVFTAQNNISNVGNKYVQSWTTPTYVCQCVPTNNFVVLVGFWPLFIRVSLRILAAILQPKIALNKSQNMGFDVGDSPHIVHNNPTYQF
jgi:hypothetical protein